MDLNFPSTESVRARLSKLGPGQIQELSRSSGVPASTLWKIRTGITGNPGIETVRKFFPLLAPIQADGAPPESAQLGAQGGGEAAAVHGLQSVLTEPLNTTQQSCGGL